MLSATADICIKTDCICCCFYGDQNITFLFKFAPHCGLFLHVYTTKKIYICEFIMLLQQFIVAVNLYFQMCSERSVTTGKIKDTLQTI